jgi:hypothetical protein
LQVIIEIVNKTQNSETVNGDNKLNKTPTKNGSYKDSVFATQPRNSSGLYKLIKL